MVETSMQPLRVTLITGTGGLDHGLQQFLQHNGVAVVNHHPLDELQLKQVDTDNIDVLLVDLEDPLDTQLQQLNWLVGRSQVPILFNAARGAPRGDAGNSLIAKLAHLARNPVSARRGSVARLSGAATVPKLRVITPAPRTEVRPAEEVWILGASLGGLQAVSRFLRTLPAELPVALVYAQHIGADFIPVLTRQMEQVAPFQVLPAKSGLILGAGQMFVVPAAERFALDEQRVIELQPVLQKLRYSPSIDNVITEVVSRYGENTGAIFFSGMGDDGVQGAREIARAGGTVWTQDVQSCQISTMPEAVRRQQVVSFSGSPEQLATRLAEVIKKTKDAQ